MLYYLRETIRSKLDDSYESNEYQTEVKNNKALFEVYQ